MSEFKDVIARLATENKYLRDLLHINDMPPDPNQEKVEAEDERILAENLEDDVKIDDDVLQEFRIQRKNMFTTQAAIKKAQTESEEVKKETNKLNFFGESDTTPTKEKDNSHNF